MKDIQATAQKIITSSNITEAATKTGVGFAGSLAAMSINDIIGAFVGIATFIYMCLQIRKLLKEEKK